MGAVAGCVGDEPGPVTGFVGCSASGAADSGAVAVCAGIGAAGSGAVRLGADCRATEHHGQMRQVNGSGREQL